MSFYPFSEMSQGYDIIVIGASRGGLLAIGKVLSLLPADLPAAVMVVLHTGPQSPRHLADILGRCTFLQVAYGREMTKIEPGHVYIAPPDNHLIVSSMGRLGLDPGPKVRYSRPAADRLFETAAAVYGPRVTGVVLTGGGDDGTNGLRAIKAAGGWSIVQDPDEAENGSMPRSALRGNFPDYCLPLADIGPILAGLSGLRQEVST